LEPLMDTLMKRVDKLVQPSRPSRKWGNPLLSTTPSSIAIRELALRTEALENAVREIALEVEKLSDKASHRGSRGGSMFERKHADRLSEDQSTK
jgi:hypothetical protein